MDGTTAYRCRKATTILHSMRQAEDVADNLLIEIDRMLSG